MTASPAAFWAPAGHCWIHLAACGCTLHLGRLCGCPGGGVRVAGASGRVRSHRCGRAVSGVGGKESILRSMGLGPGGDHFPPVLP